MVRVVRVEPDARTPVLPSVFLPVPWLFTLDLEVAEAVPLRTLLLEDSAERLGLPFRRDDGARLVVRAPEEDRVAFVDRDEAARVADRPLVAVLRFVDFFRGCFFRDAAVPEVRLEVRRDAVFFLAIESFLMKPLEVRMHRTLTHAPS